MKKIFFIILTLSIVGCSAKQDPKPCNAGTFIHRILESQNYHTVVTAQNNPKSIGGASYISSHQSHVLKVEKKQPIKDDTLWLKINHNLLEK
ncbi:hypothetical protein ABT56_18890 [Photobacterium aquae]|uniref:Lipoprotein n=1 Tax=Photobacterium aquae TaxID=1195763 RepID=A0A0J1JMW6_9GAMM|nr:hypothetical protein [Photobacterium aquae]KLV03502.1 hypothetical protein ABT56_18890 [Photobacterium aquae]